MVNIITGQALPVITHSLQASGIYTVVLAKNQCLHGPQHNLYSDSTMPRQKYSSTGNCTHCVRSKTDCHNCHYYNSWRLLTEVVHKRGGN